MSDECRACGRYNLGPDVKKCERLLADPEPEELLQLQDIFGRTGLSYAIEAGLVDIVFLLLRRGADIRKLGNSFQAGAVELAAKHNHVHLFPLLIAAGAGVNDISGKIALQTAASAGHAGAVRALLAASAQLAAVVGPKYTAAATKLAAEHKHEEVLTVFSDLAPTSNGTAVPGTCVTIARSF